MKQVNQNKAADRSAGRVRTLLVVANLLTTFDPDHALDQRQPADKDSD